MPTIRQMYAGTYNFYKTIYSGGQIYRQTVSSPAKNTNFLNTSYRDLLSSYSATKNTFNANFDEKISDLKNSAADVKNIDFASEKPEDAIKTVENFLSDYNGATNFFAENSSVSNRVGNLARNFSDATYFSRNYSQIGIEVGKDGSLTLDEEKFTSALEGDSKKVSRILDNLTSRAESKANLASLQKNSLFPTAMKMFGTNLNSSLYGKNSLLSPYFSAGSLFNIMF